MSERRDNDPWGLTVIGIPRQQRHESGVGFKPIQADDYDFNHAHWLDGPLGYTLRSLPKPDEVAVGDVIFLYADGHTPDAFGFLYRVTEIQDDRATVVPASPIRFQSQPDDKSDYCELLCSSPEGYGARDSSYRTCPHLAPTTSVNSGHIVVRCSDCTTEAAS